MTGPGCWATAPLLALADAEGEVAELEPDEDDLEGAGVVLEPLVLELPLELTDDDAPVDDPEALVVIEPDGEVLASDEMTLPTPT